MYLWRISKFADLTGNGCALRSGRWHQRGTPVVYCSDHPSTALLEVLVHVDFEEFPASYTLLKIACPDDLAVQAIDSEAVDFADLVETQTFGNSLLRQSNTCLFSVPSVVMPEARNVLINPQHKAASQIRIETIATYPLDQRFRR
jgi:RES domain-containing protein